LRTELFRGLALQSLFYVGLVLAWEWSVALFGIRSYLLPPPSAIVARMLEIAPTLGQHGLHTLSEALLGFGISIVVGVLVATLIAYSAFLRSVVLPLLVAVNAIPKVAIAPLLIIWFGIGFESKVAMAFLLSFFPIVMNATTGMLDIEPAMLNLLRMMGANQVQQFLKVRLPHALPGLMDGLKIALPLAIIGAIIGEFVGSQRGLGYLILAAGLRVDTESIFAVVLLVAIGSMALYQVLVVVESRILKWRPSAQVF
jgi:NitT/TauT family transport system permease protein